MINETNPNFNLAKQQVIYGLNKFARFSNDMNIKFPKYGFKTYTDKLRVLKDTVQSASGPCFSAADIEEIENFSKHIASNQDFISHYFIHSFLHKLQVFWNLRNAIISTGKTATIILWKLSKKELAGNVLDEISQSIKRAFQVTKTTNYIVEAILNNRPYNILSLTSVLLALIIRVEAHEYEIENIVTNAKKHINLDYDIQEILSVDSKVQKGIGWKSDTRAIRDAIAHASFNITEVKEDYIIHFKNNEQGYNSDKSFTTKEMMLFYQDYDRLIAIQTLLLNSALITDFITKEFKM